VLTPGPGRRLSISMFYWFAATGLTVGCLSWEIGAEEANLLLWNGETAGTYEYGSASMLDPFRGRACFEGIPDAYHEPRISLNGLGSWRADISNYDEIWFFARCDHSGKTFDFTVTGYPNVSKKININSYIAGGVLDTAYRLVRIPLSVLKTTTYLLDNVENLRFGLATPTAGHRIYIDEIWTVKRSVPDPAYTPLVGTLPSVDFGNSAVAATSSKMILVTNIGNGVLTVSGAYITGADAASFTLNTAPFTVPPGQSQQVAVHFSPLSPGTKSAMVVLKHTATVLGNTTEIPVTGNGIGPALVLSTPSLDFGSVPVGMSATWMMTLSNPGNEDLVVSSMDHTNPVFGVSPFAFIVPPGGAQEIAAAFSPTDSVVASGASTVHSNDPVHSVVMIPMTGEGLPSSGSLARLKVLVGALSSSTAPLSWPRFSGIEEVRVYLSAEPAASPGAALPVLLAALPAETVNYTVEKLTAGTHAFFDIEARTGGNLVAAGGVHVHTEGGPGAVLDTPVRQVHVCAPNILQLVLANPGVQSYSGSIGSLAGYTGPVWQAGPWTVTRYDGTELTVTHVYRHSIPVGQTQYELGYGTNTNDRIVDVDHHLFLVLDAALVNGGVFRIQGPLGLDAVLPFSDRYLETPVLQVNQAGYNPRAAKRYAYLCGWLGDGGPLSLAGFPNTADVIMEPEDVMMPRTAVVSNLPISVRAANDVDAGAEVREVDLAGVPPAEGAVYRVRIPGVGVSWPTQVSETAAFKVFFTAARGLYYNRWGRNLRPECTGWGPRPADHPKVHDAELLDEAGEPIFGFGANARFPENTVKGAQRPLSGGHHNAGDFDVQLSDHVIGMMLLRLYEINPAAYTDGQLMIPESGNGIPDILDEALWNLRAWEQLQEGDGGIRAGVESWREPWGIYYADQDPLPYWTYSRHTLHTLRVAGLFAQASRLVAPFNELKARELQDRAIRAYAYAVTHGASQNSRGPMLYGAGELFRLTGLQRYADMFTATWKVEDKYGLGPGMYAYLPDVSSYYDPVPYLIPDHLLGYIGSPNANPTYVSQIRAKLTTMANNAVTAVENLHAHRNGRDPNQNPALGKGTAVGEYVMPIYARAQMGGLSSSEWQTYLDAMSLSADYALGANPEGRVWLTNLGSRPPEDPLHLDSLAFIKEGKKAVPGYPVFGPTKGLSGLSYYDYGENVFYPAFLDHPLMRRYADIHTFVANNEGLSQLMAIHTELFGMLLATGMMPKPSWLPTGEEHRNPLPPRESLLPETGAGHLVFTQHPVGAHRYLEEGDYTLTAATSGGTGGVNYRWKHSNGVETVTVGTGASHTIVSPDMPDEGAYYCVATDSAGESVSSHIAYVFFAKSMSFTSAPEGGLVDVGGTWTFSVGVEGGLGPLSYQWTFERPYGARLPVGNNTPMLTLSSITGDNQGDYFVAVSDGRTSITSDSAYLDVNITMPGHAGIIGLLFLSAVCAVSAVACIRKR